MKFIDPSRYGDYAKAPIWVFSHQGVSMGAKFVYIRLLHYRGINAYAFPKIETLARDVNLGESQVRQYIKELVDAGWITRVRRGQGRANQYWFNHLPEMDSGVFEMNESDFECRNTGALDQRNTGAPYKKTIHRKQSIEKVCPLPTVEDVAAYMKERGWNDVSFNAKKFHDYYSAGDWKMKDGSKVKNWKRCVITWENTDRKRVQPTQEKASIQAYDPSKAGLFK